jgi:hypothetical protein
VEQFCARCGHSFQCNKETIEKCDCSLVKLDEATIKFLKSTNYSCLCTECLVHYDELVMQAKGLDFPSAPGKLIEGLHYYIENNNWVFTELYHFLRGYCCGNGCRHCVYGFSKQKP